VTRRLHHAPLPEAPAELTLSPEAARHARVLRLREGDALVLFDGRGSEADARVIGVDPLRCTVEPARIAAEAGPRVVLCYAVPKGSKKLDQVVRGATEVGVAAIHLVLTERCVARPERDARGKLERLARVATEAARQSGRATVPDVIGPAPLSEVAARAPAGARRVVAAPGHGAFDAGGDEAWLIVGPEGGLSDAELEGLGARGFTPIGLGPTVLRTETAAVVAPALVLDRLRRGGPVSGPSGSKLP